MTPHVPEEFSTRLIDWSPFVIMGNTMPPRDPDEDEEDEDGGSSGALRRFLSSATRTTRCWLPSPRQHHAPGRLLHPQKHWVALPRLIAKATRRSFRPRHAGGFFYELVKYVTRSLQSPFDDPNLAAFSKESDKEGASIDFRSGRLEKNMGI